MKVGVYIRTDKFKSIDRFQILAYRIERISCTESESLSTHMIYRYGCTSNLIRGGKRVQRRVSRDEGTA